MQPFKPKKNLTTFLTTNKLQPIGPRKKNHATSLAKKKTMQPLGPKKIKQPLGPRKNPATP